MKKLLHDEGGQAIVEYMLMLTVAIGAVTIIAVGFRRSIFKLWTTLAKEISAACPGCPPDPSIR